MSDTMKAALCMFGFVNVALAGAIFVTWLGRKFGYFWGWVVAFQLLAFLFALIALLDRYYGEGGAK